MVRKNGARKDSHGGGKGTATHLGSLADLAPTWGSLLKSLEAMMDEGDGEAVEAAEKIQQELAPAAQHAYDGKERREQYCAHRPLFCAEDRSYSDRYFVQRSSLI